MTSLRLGDERGGNCHGVRLSTSVSVDVAFTVPDGVAMRHVAKAGRPGGRELEQNSLRTANDSTSRTQAALCAPLPMFSHARNTYDCIIRDAAGRHAVDAAAAAAAAMLYR